MIVKSVSWQNFILFLIFYSSPFRLMIRVFIRIEYWFKSIFLNQTDSADQSQSMLIGKVRGCYLDYSSFMKMSKQGVSLVTTS